MDGCSGRPWTRFFSVVRFSQEKFPYGPQQREERSYQRNEEKEPARKQAHKRAGKAGNVGYKAAEPEGCSAWLGRGHTQNFSLFFHFFFTRK